MTKPSKPTQELLPVLGVFAEDIAAAESFRALQTAVTEFLTRFGVKMMSYHHLPPLGAADYTPQITVAATGFPEEWVDQYVAEELYNIDPIPKRALAATSSFRWSETRHMPGLTKDELRYLDLLEAAKLGDGLAVPVFGPFGRNGYVGLGFGRMDKTITDREVLFLQIASQLGHQAYCELLHKSDADCIELSPREAEILTWVSRGKSNAVIGQILSISTHTVDTHLRRAFNKLDVRDRVTAALRGAALGLI